MIVLFDIDGTLLSCGGAGRRALISAFEEVLSAGHAVERVRLAGSTDPRIIEDTFLVAWGRAPGPDDPIEEVLERYLVHLERELQASESGYRVLEGSFELLEALERAGRFALGLATGNVERGARAKLERGGLSSYFAFGGFGSDAPERAALVEFAIERGRDRAARMLGRAIPKEEVLVLGDTEHDVEAARTAGVRSIGVLAGSGHRDALEASRPDLLADSLRDPRLWAMLGL